MFRAYITDCDCGPRSSPASARELSSPAVCRLSNDKDLRDFLITTTSGCTVSEAGSEADGFVTSVDLAAWNVRLSAMLQQNLTKLSTTKHQTYLHHSKSKTLHCNDMLITTIPHNIDSNYCRNRFIHNIQNISLNKGNYNFWPVLQTNVSINWDSPTYMLQFRMA